MKQLLFFFVTLFPVLPLIPQDGSVNLLPPDKRSSNFLEVAKNLDLGGSVYAFVDVDGDLSRLMKEARDLITIFKDDVPESVQPILGNLNFEGILDVLGLGGIQAFGLSSHQDGEVFRNKTFIKLEKGPQGLFRIMGGEPHPFASWQLAPVGTDLVWEQDLNLKAIEPMVFAILKQIMGPPGADIAEGFLKQKPEGLDFTWKELIDKLDTRIVAIGRFDPNNRISVPVPNPGALPYDAADINLEGFEESTIGASTEDVFSPEEEPREIRLPDEPKDETDEVDQHRMINVPMVDFYVSFENLGWLVDQASKELDTIQEIEKFSVNGWRGYGFSGQMPPQGEAYKPYLLHELNTGRLVLVSRPEFMNACLSNTGGIKEDADFHVAVRGLPNQGNGFTYFSSEVVDQFGGLIADLAEGDEEGQKMLPWVLGALGHFKKPQAAVYSNQQDGVLFAANQAFTHKGNLFMAMMPSPVTLGAMFLTMGLSQEFNMSSLTTDGQPDQQVAMDNLRELGNIYISYLRENNGSHIPASVSGVHGWAMELEDKVGYDDASVYLLDGDLAKVEHEGDIAESVRDKSFPGMPFSISLVAGLSSDAPGSTTPLAWTRGLQPDGSWSFDSPFYGEGGFILFLDGHVEFHETVDGALLNFETKEPTSDIAKALPQGAKILEYEMQEPALEIPEFEVPAHFLEVAPIPTENVQQKQKVKIMPKRRILEDGTEINTTPILVPEIGVPTKPVPELSPESTSDPESVSGSEGSVPEPPE